MKLQYEPDALFIVCPRGNYDVPLYVHIETELDKPGYYARAGQRLKKGIIVALLGMKPTETGDKLDAGIFMTPLGIFRIYLEDLKLCT
jgi:hypothetical protein